MAIDAKATQEDLYLYEILRNPILAGEFIYNYDIREGIDPEFNYTWYQREQLVDFSPYQSFCQARSTGKTLTFVSLILWFIIFNVFPKETIMFAVPSKIHLQPVWDGLTRSFRSNSFLKNFISPSSGINSSNNTMKFLNYTMLDCRIAGQSGTGANFAGAHVPAVLVDESGYFPWSAFQEMQPCLNTFTTGYREIVAGVPTGIRDGSVLFFADQTSSNYSKHRASSFDNPRITTEDHAHAEEQYGGKDNPDYVHYHLGEHGLPVYALFDRGLMSIESYPVYKLVMNGQVIGENLTEYVNKLSIFPGIGEKKTDVVIGIDLGFTEPTAILIMYTDVFGRLRFHGRIQLEKVSYTIQEKIIDFLDTKFDPIVLGMDKGSAGISTYQHLIADKEYIHKNYEKRLLPIDFSGVVILGIDANGEEIKSRTKPFSTTVLQDYTNNHKIIYSSTDLEMITELERMTYSKNINGDIAYRTLTIKGGKKGDDHFTSALLCGTLAYYLTTDFLSYKQQKKSLARTRWF